VQLVERGPDGEERPLRSPQVFMWGADCFPNLEPHLSGFVLPDTTARTSASLGLDDLRLTSLMPELSPSSVAVGEVRLKFGNPRVESLARGDLSGRFSPSCVEALRRTVRAGDRFEWFGVVVDAVVSDSVELEIHWKLDASAEAKQSAAGAAESSLAAVLQQDPGDGDGEESLAVRLAATDERHTSFSGRGRLVIGYRTRPLASYEVMLGDAPPSEPALALAGVEPRESDPSRIEVLQSALPQIFADESPGSEGHAVARLSIFLVSQGGMREVDLRHRFRSGDAFRLAIASNRDAWLAILHASGSDAPELLWPAAEPGDIEAPLAVRVRARQTVLVPPKPGRFVFDEEVGREQFYVALFAGPRVDAASAAPVEQDGTVSPLPPEDFQVFVREPQESEVRGLAERGVVFDPGPANDDRGRYLAPGDPRADRAIVHGFRLRHEE
jgi:hypothetical protein